mmetsp:Transcript_27810/g.54748  ORF Transcript_27810/g.54748 Transcript_27810/m.54748 type:complete len:338 (+) Transcript_27810:62-1075(+)
MALLPVVCVSTWHSVCVCVCVSYHYYITIYIHMNVYNSVYQERDRKLNLLIRREEHQKKGRVPKSESNDRSARSFSQNLRLQVAVDKLLGRQFGAVEHESERLRQVFELGVQLSFLGRGSVQNSLGVCVSLVDGDVRAPGRGLDQLGSFGQGLVSLVVGGFFVSFGNCDSFDRRVQATGQLDVDQVDKPDRGVCFCDREICGQLFFHLALDLPAFWNHPAGSVFTAHHTEGFTCDVDQKLVRVVVVAPIAEDVEDFVCFPHVLHCDLHLDNEAIFGQTRHLISIFFVKLNGVESPLEFDSRAPDSEEMFPLGQDVVGHCFRNVIIHDAVLVMVDVVD